MNMVFVGLIICIHFILIVVYLLYKKINAPFVLFLAGIGLFAFAYFMGNSYPASSTESNLEFFNIFSLIKDSFVSIFAEVGIMIMIIGGFVNYMRKIGASNALIYVSLQPLSIFKRDPYFAAILMIPIGQMLFMAIPSATGLGLLLVVTIFPVLVKMGISKISAVSVITACTVFDLGPGSFNTYTASQIVGKQHVNYFLEDQLPLAIPLTLVLMGLMYFFNKYFDKREGYFVKTPVNEELKVSVPLIYSILPLLPIILMIVFPRVAIGSEAAIRLDTSTAMLATVFIAMLFELIRGQKVSEIAKSLFVFWEGMGKMFGSVVVLIVAASIFAKGLINAGFIDGLVQVFSIMGLGTSEFGVVMTSLVYTSSVLTGSGSASFNAFAPIVSSLGLNVGGITIILSMQLASSLGRAISPISGVVVASSEIAKISPFQLAKRNAIPLTIILIIILIYFYVEKKVGIY